MIGQDNLMLFEVGRERPLYRRGRPFYGGEVHFTPMRENITSSKISVDIFKPYANVHCVKAEVYFNIKFGCQIAMEMHSDGQKNPRPYSVTA